MLAAVLKNVPTTWDTKSYSNSPYHLVEVDKNTEEFMAIEHLFDGYIVLKIERVQNPYQYGRFLLHKEHEGLSGCSEVKRFIAVTKDKLDIALRYNCDHRRLDEYLENLFTTVPSAHAYIQSGIMIVLEAIEGRLNRDSTKYPQYVVTYEITS